MNIAVRKKIWLGTGFLFLLLMLMGGTGIYFTAKLKQEAKAVLQDNYESLSYCHSIQQQLSTVGVDLQGSLTGIEKALTEQEKNITERGEREATGALRTHVNQLAQGDTTTRNLDAIDHDIQTILALNMSAIQQKNEKAQSTAENALKIIISLAFLVLVIAFTFSVNFPSIVTKPISQLSEAIEAIANKNYTYRVRITRKDEFGQLATAFNNMADRLEYFENSNVNKLLFEKARAEAVINSLKDASIGIDKNGIILFANYQALQLLGLKSADIVTKTVKELSDKNDLFRFLLHSETAAPFKIVVEGKENYFIREIIEVSQGENNSRVIVLRNITSFKELDVAKTNFIATISHELKTPLAASDLSLKLLEKERTGTLTEDQRELIQSLKQDNQRVLKILSELLNMSQIETGRIQLDVQSVSPYLIVDNAINAVTTVANEKNITFKRRIDENLPSIKADAEKTTWVLNNLLTNAIKYSSDHDDIEISASLEDHAVIFTVKDHGPGIAEEYLLRLFEKYFQVPGSKAKGTGLGLAISKDFIEAQGGKIWVESEPGHGARFSFALAI